LRAASHHRKNKDAELVPWKLSKYDFLNLDELAWAYAAADIVSACRHRHLTELAHLAKPTMIIRYRRATRKKMRRFFMATGGDSAPNKMN